ncbi:D-aminopeptidase [Roseicella frigidaeris]|uniref:Aminopeptidase n=1 Tax=Roseicella frigidaeris TaxID=2230885 RepID=A0A327M6Y5_9PROT|nr:D-aminopeptidase [Roseicella frigidaeris]RAI58710.1 aminopeptidase [Roseicella frigidaeris]
MAAGLDPGLATRLDRLARRLPRTYPGPGGALAVLRQGEVLLRHAWGFANAERRIPFTPQTLFRLCSITKQFTCAAMLEACPDPAVLDAAIRARLPRLGAAAPGALHCAHNQSGLRDYWAVAMLHGSPVEAPFGDAEAMRVIAGTASLHFAPGTRYSYVNQNFRLLSEALETETGQGFAALLRRLFERAGMPTAFLAADTRAMPDGTEGYEGSQAGGFRAAENRILWTGDAGLGASLEDMIAWERFLDAGRDDPGSLPARLAAPVAFAGGAPAPYGFGLARGTAFGHALLGHGGALRGWRSHRLYVPAERISVVVLFNHLSDAHAAAMEALATVLDAPMPGPDAALPMPAWAGAYAEPETGLLARIEPAMPGRLRLRFGHSPELLDLQPDGSATNGQTRLQPGPAGLWLERPQENFRSRLEPLNGMPATDIAGRYRCEELEAELHIAAAGGLPYGGFAGVLGQGRMELLEPVAQDVWTLPCPRALDHTPPGDWTLAFRRGADGQVEGVRLGCWLARGLDYRRIG